WLDPDEEHKRHLDEVVAAQDCLTSILIGGSTGVTEQSMDRAIKKLVEKGYPSQRIGLVPSSHFTFSTYARYAVFPFCVNASVPYFHYDFLYKSIDIVNAYHIIPIPTAYLLTSPAEQTTVGRVLQPDIIKDVRSAERYTKLANLLRFQTLSLEAGSGAQYPVSSEIVAACRHNFNSLITVGGGIKTPDDAKKIIDAGANIIIIGDAIEKSPQPREFILSVYDAVSKNSHFE
ncbi:MAG: geranylgeranylglyceryl/heptaprenylglyceryl phosphate synthase, partial [Nanoarchaeota archaeon]